MNHYENKASSLSTLNLLTLNQSIDQSIPAPNQYPPFEPMHITTSTPYPIFVQQWLWGNLPLVTKLRQIPGIPQNTPQWETTQTHTPCSNEFACDGFALKPPQAQARVQHLFVKTPPAPPQTDCSQFIYFSSHPQMWYFCMDSSPLMEHGFLSPLKKNTHTHTTHLPRSFHQRLYHDKLFDFSTLCGFIVPWVLTQWLETQSCHKFWGRERFPLGSIRLYRGSQAMVLNQTTIYQFEHKRGKQTPKQPANVQIDPNEAPSAFSLHSNDLDTLPQLPIPSISSTKKVHYSNTISNETTGNPKPGVSLLDYGSAGRFIQHPQSTVLMLYTADINRYITVRIRTLLNSLGAGEEEEGDGRRRRRKKETGGAQAYCFDSANIVARACCNFKTNSLSSLRSSSTVMSCDCWVSSPSCRCCAVLSRRRNCTNTRGSFKLANVDDDATKRTDQFTSMSVVEEIAVICSMHCWGEREVMGRGGDDFGNKACSRLHVHVYERGKGYRIGVWRTVGRREENCGTGNGWGKCERFLFDWKTLNRVE